MTSSKSDPCDLLALPLDEARERLQADGVPFEVLETAPPHRPLTGEWRVLAVRVRGDRVTLVAGRIPDAAVVDGGEGGGAGRGR